MKKISLRSKISWLVIAAVACVMLTAIVSATISSTLMSAGLAQAAQERADTVLDVVAENMDTMKQKLQNALGEADAIPGIAAALRDRNTAAARSIGRGIMDRFNLPFAMLIDKNGILVGQGQSDQNGNDLSRQASVRQALGGVPAYGIESGVLIQFAFRGAAPIHQNGEIVGCISVGFPLVSDTHDFVDNIKKRFNVECTIFEGNRRVTTTIADSKGKRAIGTTLDNPTILQTVLSNGQTYYGKNVILGADYISGYQSIQNSTEKNIGILFVGIRLSDVLDTLKNSIRNIIIIAGIVCVLLYFGGHTLARSLTRAIAAGAEQIEMASNTVEEIARKVLVSSNTMSNAANSQAAAMEETTASVSGVASHAKQTDSDLNKAEEQMETAKQSVQQAGASIEELVASMTEIAETSNNILTITQTINDIAFQTNLLALNAAVEAARAGEAGAGFAVVANEVRGLALRSSQAVRETEELVEVSKKKIEDGMGLATKSSVEFSGVAQSTQAMVGTIDKIARNTHSQVQEIEQINKVIGDMNLAIQHTASNAQAVDTLAQNATGEAEKAKTATKSLHEVVFGTWRKTK